MSKDEEVQILELSIQVLTAGLDELIGACFDDAGRPKAPSTKDLYRARSLLPAKYEHALTAKAKT